MSQIITISREFGSGGRELGKRLAELLGCDYYDREIITAIARQSGLDEGYVERAAEGETLSRRDIQQNIRRIDKGRARVRELLGGGAWGGGSTYHLTVNTTDWEIKELAPAAAGFASRWFRKTQ